MTTQLTWQAEEVIRAVRGQCLHEQSWKAHGVSIDSRSIHVGDLFIALKGPVHDGHEYVAAAFAAGAAAAIVSRQPSQAATQSPLIFVDDTFVALEDLGRVGRQRSSAKIIAVTGSVGKTSTKDMLRQILSAVGATYANEGSLNNHWGVPLSLARLPSDVEYGVFELGMNHAGELGPLSRQVHPDVTLITNVEAAHLEFFKSIEAIADAKAEIFLGMSPDGTAILNRDNSHFARLVAAARTQGLKRILSFGSDAKSDARLLTYSNGENGSEIKAEILGRVLDYRLGAPGIHLALNSLAALLATVTASGDLDASAAALACYRQPEGRGGFQAISLTEGSITISDESYNASPVSIRAAIRVLQEATPKANGRRFLVLGDMRELGETSAQLHAELARDIIAAKIDRVYCCGEMMAKLYEALPTELQGFYTRDSAEMAPHVAIDIQNGDIITVKGSNAMRMNIIVDAIKALQKHIPQHKLAS